MVRLAGECEVIDSGDMQKNFLVFLAGKVRLDEVGGIADGCEGACGQVLVPSER